MNILGFCFYKSCREIFQQQFATNGMRCGGEVTKKSLNSLCKRYWVVTRHFPKVKKSTRIKNWLVTSTWWNLFASNATSLTPGTSLTMGRQVFETSPSKGLSNHFLAHIGVYLMARKKIVDIRIELRGDQVWTMWIKVDFYCVLKQAFFGRFSATTSNQKLTKVMLPLNLFLQNFLGLRKNSMSFCET